MIVIVFVALCVNFFQGGCMRASNVTYFVRVCGCRYSHAGQPNCFNYEWQMMPPQ